MRRLLLLSLCAAVSACTGTPTAPDQPAARLQRTASDPAPAQLTGSSSAIEVPSDSTGTADGGPMGGGGNRGGPMTGGGN